MSNSLQPYGLQPTRLFYAWVSPGKNTGVGCHALSPGELPDPGIKPASLTSPALADVIFTTSASLILVDQDYSQVGKIPWRRERLPNPVLWPGEFDGMESPWGRKEWDMTERLSLSRLLFFSSSILLSLYYR